jgi:exodeoxyribonuclease V alpha subunit
VIVDEASMIDLALARSLLQALPERARLVIVGDADQLPSVAAGAVLRDVISSGVVPVIALTRVFRQAEQSSIVSCAHAILHGMEPRGADNADGGADFFVIERTDEAQAAATIEKLVKERIPERFGFDPRADVQVLSPMRRGACGTTALNQRLQAALNPSGASLKRGSDTFRIGDRVMQLRNDYDKEIYNGDQGRITRVAEDGATLDIEFDGKSVRFLSSELEDITLSYASTIHKSQGSEYPAVVVPLLMSHFIMLSRNLLYTAVTRARKLCVVVGDPKALRLALSEVKRELRNTRLEARLREACR